MLDDHLNGGEANGIAAQALPGESLRLQEGTFNEPFPDGRDAASQDAEVVKNPPRFRIFIVDSGWNSAARRVLHQNFHLLRELQRETPIYFLGRERSIELMRRYPALVGKDPIIRVHCDIERKHRNAGFHGFRLHLGLLQQPSKALQALQNFTRVIGTHCESADLEADMRKRLRQEGLQGAFEIVLHGEAHGVSI
ncbi:MAG: hypothetical protein ABSC06_19250 [Rhodopila sp.]|jgi:hypothetical protein